MKRFGATLSLILVLFIKTNCLAKPADQGQPLPENNRPCSGDECHNHNPSPDGGNQQQTPPIQDDNNVKRMLLKLAIQGNELKKSYDAVKTNMETNTDVDVALAKAKEMETLINDASSTLDSLLSIPTIQAKMSSDKVSLLKQYKSKMIEMGQQTNALLSVIQQTGSPIDVMKKMKKLIETHKQLEQIDKALLDSDNDK